MYKQILTKLGGKKKINTTVVNTYQFLWNKGIISTLVRVVREGFTEVIGERSLNRYTGMQCVPSFVYRGMNK